MSKVFVIYVMLKIMIIRGKNIPFSHDKKAFKNNAPDKYKDDKMYHSYY